MALPWTLHDSVEFDFWFSVLIFSVNQLESCNFVQFEIMMFKIDRSTDRTWTLNAALVEQISLLCSGTFTPHKQSN